MNENNDRSLWVAFLSTILFLVAFTATLFVIKPFAGQIAQENIFPNQVLDMKQVSIISGDEAKQSVNGLHGLDIPLKNAYIATYQGANNASAIIWVSESFNREDATKLFKVMDEKMPTSKSFSKYERVKYQDLDLRYVYWDSKNMHDFYYLSGNKNYWLAVSVNENIKTFLDEVLPKFR